MPGIELFVMAAIDEDGEVNPVVVKGDGKGEPGDKRVLPEELERLEKLEDGEE